MIPRSWRLLSVDAELMILVVGIAIRVPRRAMISDSYSVNNRSATEMVYGSTTDSVHRLDNQQINILAKTSQWQCPFVGCVPNPRATPAYLSFTFVHCLAYFPAER